jgi:hypothetical protein
VFALCVEQFLVEFPINVCDGVIIHGWVVSVTNELDTLLEIFEQADVV